MSVSTDTPVAVGSPAQLSGRIKLNSEYWQWVGIIDGRAHLKRHTESNTMSQGNLSLAAEDIQNHLLTLQLVTRAEWGAAVETAQSPPNISDVLARLQQMPAAWGAMVGHDRPTLTSYQVEEILAGRVSALRLAHYVILEPLGRGGCGNVFVARNINIPRIEALKVLRAPASTTQIARFEREVWCLSHLHHRGFTPIYYAGQIDDTVFYTMEYISGRTVGELVEGANAEDVRLPIAFAARLTYEVASALRAAHDRGVIHRDIKPANLVVTPEGRVKVLDWSIAKLRAPDPPEADWTAITAEATAIGSTQVMPPEQWIDGRVVTRTADLYSLGCTFFYLLTGQMPFDAPTFNGLMLAHATDPPATPSDLRLEIPAELDRIVLKMIAKAPAERYQTATELMRDLRPFTFDEHDLDRSALSGHTRGSPRMELSHTT
jgi:serine/threonine protein kinase